MNSTPALLKDRGLRGRLFAVLGSSLALGDHLVANPEVWHLLAGSVTLPRADELRRDVRRLRRRTRATAAAAVMPQLRTLYRDRLLVLAALDLAPDGRERAGAGVRHRRRTSCRHRRRRAWMRR